MFYQRDIYVIIGKWRFLVFVVKANNKGDVYVNIKDQRRPGWHFSNHASGQRHEKQKGGMGYKANEKDKLMSNECKPIYLIGFGRGEFMSGCLPVHPFPFTPYDYVDIGTHRGLMFDFYIAPLDIDCNELNSQYSPHDLIKIFKFPFFREQLFIVVSEGQYKNQDVGVETTFKGIVAGKSKEVSPGRYETEPFMINGDYF